MDQQSLDSFNEIWAVDFEFSQPPGSNPKPICLVARELNSGRTLRIWEDELLKMPSPPYDCGSKSLFIAYYATAEMRCHLALGWELPLNVIDLYAEFRCITNGQKLSCGQGLLGATTYFGLDFVDVTEKEIMRELAIRGGPWTTTEKAELLEYCETDVLSLGPLYNKMSPLMSFPHARIRGNYIKCIAKMESLGVPLDVDFLNEFLGKWDDIKEKLINRVDANYSVFSNGIFKTSHFEEFLSRSNISWPINLGNGRLRLDDDTFSDMAKIYPETIGPLKELRATLSQMKKFELAVGDDGRNRCMLSPFRARTSRNQPSNSQFIFGPSKWLRHLIKPRDGFALAYIDWEQQEFGIAAALSNDQRMMEAYLSGDAYLGFAKQAGAIAPEMSENQIKNVRNQFKQCALGVQYGAGPRLISLNGGISLAKASDLLRIHKETYSTFWRWSDAISDFCFSESYLETVFGWRLNIHDDGDPNPRSIRNFPMQANGAEILRIASTAISEKGITICAPIHDAILIESSVQNIERDASIAEKIMSDAGALILNDFRLRTETKIVRFPERYEEEKGKDLWKLIIELMTATEIEASGMDI